MKVIFRALFVAIVISMVGYGCSSMSLFSSRHVHYHASEDADEKISELEARVKTLETKK